MNTKIIFSCIEVNHNGFTKIVFETILSGNSIHSISDANDWVDDNISKHYYDFELEYVLDWFVLLFEHTDNETKETEIIKTVNGKLIFEDDDDYHYYELGKVVHEKNEVKHEIKKIKKEIKDKKNNQSTKKKKEYPSVWIQPTGEVHEVGFACHNDFASDWLEQHDKKTYEKVLNGLSSYYYEALQDLGWIRILGWSEPPIFVITGRVTPKQRITLKDYCLKNNVPYDAFPEILKS